jgi:hypothetical protein
VPQTKLIYFKDASGPVPVLEWLSQLRRRDKKVYAKCVIAIELLHQLGHELRRPIADYLRDGIYELRPKSGRVNYRILYFFHGRDVAVLASGLTKEADLPAVEIDRAIRRKQQFDKNPAAHTYEEADKANKPH